MKFFSYKSLKVEIAFMSLSWLLILVYSVGLSWFYNEKILVFTYIFPVLFIFFAFLGSKLALVKPFDSEEFENRDVPVLLMATIGLVSVALLFIDNIGNLNKHISEVRKESLEATQIKTTFLSTIFNYTFPLFIMAFIIANINNHRYKNFINISAVACCFVFVPINGGRVFFLIFGVIFSSIYLIKNREKILKSIKTNFLKLFLILQLVSILATIYSTLRLNTENEYIINNLSRIGYIDKGMLDYLSKSKIGIYLIIYINTIYEYTGGNIYRLSIFIENFDKLKYCGYGFFQFSIFDKFGIVNWLKVHDEVDKLYVNYDIYYNVWASSLRDIMVDFGIVGTLIFSSVISVIMYKARGLMFKSNAAQVLYIVCFSFFLFSPFHSLFYLNQTFCITFLYAAILTLRFKGKKISR